MSNEFYDDLSTSLNQALAIAKGKLSLAESSAMRCLILNWSVLRQDCRSSNSLIS